MLLAGQTCLVSHMKPFVRLKQYILHHTQVRVWRRVASCVVSLCNALVQGSGANPEIWQKGFLLDPFCPIVKKQSSFLAVPSQAQ